MTQVRQIRQTRDAITVIDEMACKTIVLTIITEDCEIYAVQDDDAAYQLIPDGGDRWELSPQSVGSTFDGMDTRYVVAKKGDRALAKVSAFAVPTRYVVAANGDGARWETTTAYAIE